MTAIPNPDESQIVTRSMECRCGKTFEQKAVTNPVSQRPFGWAPLRCLECQTSRDAQQAREATEQLSLLTDARRRRALKDLDVPPLYAGATIATFQLHGSAEVQAQLLKIKELACGYLADWPRIQEEKELLLFQGSYGSGKGHIAWSIARALAACHASQVRVVKLAAVIRDLREAWRDPEGPSEDARLERYRTLDLLVIDEVSRHAFYGKEVKQHLYDIIDDRVEQHRPTILTTNEDETGIAEILGGALWSRLQGSGGVVPFPDVDWRARGE